MSEQQLVVRVEPEHDTRVKVFVPWQRKDWIQQIRSLPIELGIKAAILECA